MEKCRQCGGFLAEAVYPVAVAVGLLLLTAWMLTTCGTRGDCYVESTGWSIKKFELKRDVAWGPDETIGSFDTIDAVKLAATKLNCPFVGDTQ